MIIFARHYVDNKEMPSASSLYNKVEGQINSLL